MQHESAIQIHTHTVGVYTYGGTAGGADRGGGSLRVDERKPKTHPKDLNQTLEWRRYRS